MREPGWYWVRHSKDWMILEWFNGEWMTMKGPYLDSDFLEIDERRIVRTEPLPPGRLAEIEAYLTEHGYYPGTSIRHDMSLELLAEVKRLTPP